jgi:SagB-type dehydrogenase family enzyme
MQTLDQPRLSMDDAFTFASRLRGKPAGMNDPGTHGEHSDPTWGVKVYSGGRRLQLPGAMPWWMDLSSDRKIDSMQRLGALLFNAVGVSRVRWNQGGAVLSSPQHPELVWRGTQLSTRRPVPSGGAMYPVEVYVAALALPHESTVYHYDAARHELIDLAHCGPAAALRGALGWGYERPLSSLALILTHRFSKNLHKYRNFAYRLGATDVGVVMGRLFACAEASFGQAEVHVDFDDSAVNAMCGLNGQEESVYAVIQIGAPEVSPGSNDWPGLPSPPPVLERGKPAQPSSLFAAMHAAACRAPLSRIPKKTAKAPADALPGNHLLASEEAVHLIKPASRVSMERREMFCRTSNGAWFTGAPLSSEVLATVLQRTYESLAALLQACPDGEMPQIGLYCAVERVIGVPSGWYCYLPSSHVLIPVGAGRVTSSARELQQALYAATVDVERSAFSLHVATVIDFRSDPRGVRAYRIQQLLVGTAIEAATRWSTIMGAGSHPLHGFDAQRVDQLYGLADTPFGVQSQVSIGNVRPAGVLEGSVVA